MRLREHLPGLRNASADTAAVAAGTDHAVAHDPLHVRPLALIPGGHTHGAQAYVVGATSLWWWPFAHKESMRPMPEAQA